MSFLLHIFQLFDTVDFFPPKYRRISPLEKLAQIFESLESIHGLFGNNVHCLLVTRAEGDAAPPVCYFEAVH